MTNDIQDWEKIEDLFHRVSSLPETAQRQYLDEHCPEDPALRARVLALLEAGRNAGDFVERTVLDAAASVRQPESRAGAYRLLREIGRGGMGSVYLAERDDQAFSRQVAVKIVRGDFSSPSMLQRFRVERQILAGLEHPYIARLLDGGATESGLPYLVMEYVDGVSIDRYCNERSLSIAQRLTVFRKVCEAVSYAHRNLIVHRDIKPGNILVTPEGVPRLLDFGIAKVLDLSAEGGDKATERLMTPEYASPEQVLGKPVAVPSDVFTLGLLLYELLSGEQALKFPTSSASERDRAICEIDPPLPSTRPGAPGVNPKDLRGDLDAIIMKALRKEPNLRYASVEQLDNELGRWMSGLPVEARSGAWTYLAGKMLRRYRVALLTALGIAVILGASATMSLLSARRERQAMEQARIQLQAALSMTNSSLFDIHASVSELPGSTSTQALIVAKTLASLSELDRNSNGDPNVRRQLALAYEKLSDIQYRDGPDILGDSEAAEASAQKALKLRQELADAQPGDAGAKEAVARDLVRLGAIRELMSKGPEVIDLYRQGLKLYESLREAGQLGRTGLAAEAAARSTFATVLATHGDVRAAFAEIQVAVRQQRALLLERPNDLEAREGLKKILLSEGSLHRDQNGDPMKAIQAFEEALGIARALVAAAPEKKAFRTGLASAINEIGNYWYGVGKPERSVTAYRESLAIVRALSEADRNDARSRRSVAVHSTNLALALEKTGNAAEAEQTYRQAISVHRELWTKNKSSFRPILDEAFARRALGQLLVKNGRAAQGREELREAVKMGERLVTSAPSNSLYRFRLAGAVEALGDERMQAGSCPEGHVQYARALELLRNGAMSWPRAPEKVQGLQQKLASCNR